MRVIAIGDVGVVGGMMHIGDEAMFDALVEALRERGATSLVGISSAPAETAERYGIEAVGRIGFTGSRADMRARFDDVLRCASGARALPADDPVWGVVDAVDGADAVAIAGGGNLASTWPLHVFERAALGAIAERLGRPLVVTGQTFGPRLDADDRELVGRMLRSARLVGVREHASAESARSMGVPPERLAANRDDASFLGFGGAERGVRANGTAAAPEASAGRILVSLSVSLGGLPRERTLDGLAASLDALADRTGLTFVFHPHFGSADATVAAGDEVLHDEVRSRLRTPSESLQPGEPGPAARLAREAAMLVTSRYHPAVFAAPGGVPIAALAADDYTSVKLGGATGWWEQDGVVELATAASPAGADALQRVWDGRHATRERTLELLPAAQAASAAWFDRVVDALS